jgi:hypothetical protein
MYRTLETLRDQSFGCANSSAVAEDQAKRQHHRLNTARTIAREMTNNESQIAIWPKI